MHILTYCAFMLLVVTLCLAAPTKPSNGCGYATCNLDDPTKLNMHLVPHTHDDVGWLKTVDQYYYGDRNNIQRAAVQYVLDSVVLALDENLDRRFIYVEVGFFWSWWIQQTDEIRNKVVGFVNDGRLKLLSGGSCMNDEAATHYNSIIDQHSLGAAFLREQFGECGRSKIGWQIDPFGHSRKQASLFVQMGFDGFFFARADYQDRQTRNSTKTMEMVWKGSANLANALQQNEMLTMLELGQNQNGDQGVQHLANARRQNKTLTVLILMFNGIGAEGAQHLTDVLLQNKTLTLISLSGNQIDGDTEQLIEEIVLNNIRLKQSV